MNVGNKKILFFIVRKMKKVARKYPAFGAGMVFKIDRSLALRVVVGAFKNKGAP